MKQAVAFPCILLGLFLMGITRLPREFSDEVRSSAVGCLSPIWRSTTYFRSYLADRPLTAIKNSDSSELTRLRIENRNLRAQIDWAADWFLHEKRILELGDLLKKGVLDRRRSFWLDLIQRQSRSVPAQVIYRDPSSWSSTLWISVGEENNEALGETIIARNSPVVLGDSLIGVIDFVGKRQSRVRLITDSGLTPSVRVCRGSSQNREIARSIESLAIKLKDREDLSEFLKPLQEFSEKLKKDSNDLFLAKGELRGSGAPFWRSGRPILKGIGFNYDYPDAEGPPRDLRTGRPLSGSEKPAPLIRVGDHLITSGLDGVFPPGLSVATVSLIAPLKEGSFTYEIEAVPTADSLNELRSVFVLPSAAGD